MEHRKQCVLLLLLLTYFDIICHELFFWISLPSRSISFHLSIVWVSFLVSTICMLTIYCEVRKQESKTKKYNTSITESGRSNNVPQRIDHSRRFANQAMFYVLSFWLTWLFPTCTRISQFITGGSSPFPFTALFCIFIPLQGFFNVMVYLRPRYLKFKKEHSDKNICQLLFMCQELKKVVVY